MLHFFGSPYNGLPKVSSKITQRRLRLAGHAQRHPELTLHKLVLWEPQHGHATRGRPHMTYLDNLKEDTGLKSVGEIAQLMENRMLWRTVINDARAFHLH